MAQGALGDSWLMSALNMLAPFPDRLKNVVVSDRHRDKGLILVVYVVTPVSGTGVYSKPQDVAKKGQRHGVHHGPYDARGFPMSMCSPEVCWWVWNDKAFCQDPKPFGVCVQSCSVPSGRPRFFTAEGGPCLKTCRSHCRVFVGVVHQVFTHSSFSKKAPGGTFTWMTGSRALHPGPHNTAPARIPIRQDIHSYRNFVVGCGGRGVAVAVPVLLLMLLS